MVGTARSRGVKASTIATNPPSATSVTDQPPTSRSSSRATRSTAAGRSTSTAVTVRNTRKRTVADDTVLPPPKVQKNTKKSTQNVNTAPLNAPPNPSINAPPVHFLPGLPTNYHISPNSVHIDDPRLAMHPAHYHQAAMHWPYQQWPEPAPPMLPPIPSVNPSFPPPYAPNRPEAFIEIGDEFSDDEVEPAEESPDGEVEPDEVVQFRTPQNILHSHWVRNGRPAQTRPTVPSNAPAFPPGAPLVPSSGSLVLSSAPPIPTDAPLVLPSPIASQPVPRIATRPKPTLKPIRPLTPVQEDPPQSPIPQPILDLEPLDVDDIPVTTLPPLDPAQRPPGQNGYPPIWRKFMDHAEHHVLRDMVFAHPFPNASELWVREAVSTAFTSWPLISHQRLCRQSFNEHRVNLINLVMKSARSSRGRFRSKILDIIYDTTELMISPGLSLLTIANRVELLVDQNSFLHGQHLNIRNSPEQMYMSPVLKRAMEMLYMSDPWRTAIRLPCFKELTRFDPRFTTCPPTSFIAFAAAAYRNALDCLSSGTMETVSFSESVYQSIYDDLYDFIEADIANPNHGEIVRGNLKSLISGITY